MRLTTTAPVTISQIHKRSSKGSTYKKFLINQKSINGLRREVLRETLANNHSDVLLDSEDSEDYLYNSSVPHLSAFKLTSSQKRPVDNSFTLNSKRHREVEGKEYDLDEAYSFPVSHVTLPNSNSICAPGNMQTSVPSASKAIRRSLVPTKRLSAPVTLTSQLSSTSRNGKVALQILNQPEQQHRARYQTEGSRGAVKDRTGNSFPVVKVTGYNKPATLQVFIGSDQGRVTPHMFYQACRVTGKNSTPCVEKNVEGTLVIEIDIEPSKEMTVTCDCVGILKERNVDVEHRFPEECSSRSKKKSTRCRMVFRTVITNDDGSTETLQIASQPIACTQPPGIPEICKKSLTHCAASGGKELFVLGKNFLKDTQVRFYTDDWEQTVTPDKEFLQQTHLVCVVPAYRNLDISEPAVGKVAIVSGNRSSEPHSFTFTPIVPIASSSTTNRSPDKPTTCNRLSPIINERLDSGILKSAATTADSSSDSDSGLNKTTESGVIKKCNSSSDNCENVNPAVMLWPTSNDVSSITTRNCTYNVLQNANSKTMTSPTSLLRSSAIPLGRRSSTQMIVASSVCSGPTSATASTDVLSNISSAATRSPCQSTGGMMSRYPDAASVPNYFQATERAMSEYASSTAAYRNVALSDIVDPLSLKSSVVVPKLEPRCDTSYQSQAAFPPAEFSCGGVRASLTSPPVVRCTSSASDLYSKSQSAYSAAASVSATTSSAADLYGSGKPVGVVENLTTFGVGSGGGGGNGVGADPCGVLSTGGDCSSSPLSTSSVEQSAYTSALVNGDGERRGFIKSEELSGMATLAGESAYDEINAAAAADLKNKSYQLDQMFDMKSKTPEQQQQARYENLQAASSICFKNTLMEMNQAPSNPTMSSYHQNYRNFATGDESSASSDAEMSSKLAVSQQPTTVIDSSSMLLGASAMTCVESSPSSAMILNDSKSTTSPMVVAGNVAMSPTQSAPFSLDSCTFMNAAAVAQRRQPIGNGSLVDGVNSMISVPKLEELVNKAAENHIRSASMNSLALLGPDHSANNRSAAAPNTMPYGMFTPSPSPSLSSSSSSQLNEPTFNCSPPVAVSSDKGCGVLSNTVSSLLSPYRQLTPSVCGKLSSTSDQLVQAKNIGHIANNADKLDNVAGLIKKPDDAVFAPEINRMTANDLLSYLNPSCFDQVQR